MGQITNFPNTVNVGVLSIADTEITATAAQLNSVAGAVTDATAATLTVTSADVNKAITLNRAAGVTVTLPAATGSGALYRFVAVASATSGSYILNVTGNDTIAGTATLFQDEGDTVVGFAAAAGNNRITLNGTTTGGLKGAWIDLVDADADLWVARIVSDASGTEATPFSTAS